MKIQFPFLAVFILKILLFPIGIFAQGSWIELSSPTNALLKKCIFTDTLNGWAIGDSGIIIHTSNGGTDWNIQSSEPDHFLRDIHFVNSTTGWATAWFSNFNPGTLFYKTTNGGVNWITEMYPDSSYFIESIYFTTPLNGYFGTAFPSGKIYYTTDGGISWNPSQHDSSFQSSFPIRGMKFYDSNTGFALGGFFDIAGVIWRTTDAGISWIAQSVGPEPINDILFKNNADFMAVGGDYEFGPSVSKTSNSGANWQYETLKEFGIAYSIDKRTQDQYWIALGFAGKFLYSSDAGERWDLLPTPGNHNIYCIDFVDEAHGWGVGDSGVIVKFDPSSIGITFTGSTVPEEFIVHQNYPNPFNPSTNIEIDNPSSSGFLEITIYNILGEELTKEIVKNLSSGRYRYAFDGTSYQSGVYFYRVSLYHQNKVTSQTKRMVLLK
ncbi:MAG TPA: T9SS type A sorting domain-containing protein [Ignavibacteria bacterium]|nr:T9SS type A sorting domain-containing protein [Ignavibacteria bacterium]